MPRIAVVGVGAIGAAAAAALVDAGRTPILCARRAQAGLTVRRGGAEPVRLPAPLTDPGQAPPVDWVLLAVKAHQNAGAQPWLHALCRPGAVVAVLQNGIDHAERLVGLVPPGVTVLPVVVQAAADRTDEREVVQPERGVLYVPAGEAGEAFVALFAGAAALTAAVAEDFTTRLWSKLMGNAAVGAVGALTLRRNDVLADPPVAELALGLMREVLLVARAEGARLADDAPERLLDRVRKVAADHWSSIAEDRRHGRALEWEVRNAVVGRLGRRHGIATPLNDAMTALLRAASPPRDADERSESVGTSERQRAGPGWGLGAQPPG